MATTPTRGQLWRGAATGDNAVKELLAVELVNAASSATSPFVRLLSSHSL